MDEPPLDKRPAKDPTMESNASEARETDLLENCRHLKDDELESALKFLVEREKRNLAKLLAHLAEYDRRRLCARRGHPTLFSYCLKALGYDEGGAFRRIRAARAARRWPEVLDLIERGELKLSALSVLEPILDDANRKELFLLARGKSRRGLEALVAERMPRPAQGDYSRRLPVPGGWSVAATVSVHPAEAAAPSAGPGDGSAVCGPNPENADFMPMSRPWEWQAVIPVAMDRVRIGFDAGIVVMSLIDRARQVLRHKYPEGRLEDVMKDALEMLLDRKDPQRRLLLKPASVVGDGAARAEETQEPRFLRAMKAGRYIPAWVKRAVWERDAGRCAWRFADGTQCGSKDWIEYDHVRPFAKGGRSDTPRNVRLLCRAHNRAAAEAAGLSATAS